MFAAATPRDVVEELETKGVLADGTQERFLGYGVMGMTFDSGHVLGLRRFPFSSIGPGYTAIWHRSPEHRWSFFSTVSPELSCARYTGEISDESRETAIELSWPEPNRLRVTCEDPGFVWDIRVAHSPVSRVLSAVAQRMPNSLLASQPMLRALGPFAGASLRTGRLALMGAMPNRQGFHTVPTHVWEITAGSAELRGADLGSGAPLPQQATLGDFRIPQRGLLAVAALDFDPLDPSRHSTRVVHSVDGSSSSAHEEVGV